MQDETSADSIRNLAHDVVRSLQAIQNDSPVKFTDTYYRFGTKRKITSFRFLGIVTLIGRLAPKLLCFLVFRLIRRIFYVQTRRHGGSH